MYLFFGSEAIFRSVSRSRGLSTAVNLSAVLRSIDFVPYL